MEFLKLTNKITKGNQQSQMHKTLQCKFCHREDYSIDLTKLTSPLTEYD